MKSHLLLSVFVLAFLNHANSSQLNEFKKNTYSNLTFIKRTTNILSKLALGTHRYGVIKPADHHQTEIIKKSLLTFENLTRINKQLEKESFFSNLTLKKNLMVKIKFNFSSNLTNLLTHFNINRIKVTFRNFSSFKNYVYSSETYLFKKYYTSNHNEAVCQTNAKDLGLNCYKRTAFTSTRHKKSLDNYIDLSLNYTKVELDKLIIDSNLNKAGYGEHEFLLNSIVFKINAKSNYVVCIKLLKDDMHFFTENMCYDWVISPRTEIHNFHYKPLFIVLMYMLCASILIPIAVWQHFITKAKNKRIKTFKATLLAVPNLG